MHRTQINGALFLTRPEAIVAYSVLAEGSVDALICIGYTVYCPVASCGISFLRISTDGGEVFILIDVPKKETDQSLYYMCVN